MKKKIMKQWVAALRGGEFKQGKSALDYQGQYCCLGVLCSLALVEGACEVEAKAGFYGSGAYYQYSGMGAYLPEDVKKWAGMKTETGWIPDIKSDLTALNDRGQPFTEIADVIEKHWKEL